MRTTFRWFSLLLVFIIGISTLAIGTSPVSTTSAQDSELSGELTVYLQAYYDTGNDPATAELAEEIVQEYIDMHPGVTIELVDNLPADQVETLLTTRMSAGEAPDIIWQQFANRNTRGDDWWVPLNDYFEMANPYIAEGTPGSERWADSFPDFVMRQIQASDGNWYQVALDWVETGVYYNKDLFDQAGVDPSTWSNWSTFIDDMNTVRDETGIDPLGMFIRQQGWSNWWWVDDIMLTVAWADLADQFYMEKYNDPNNPWRQLTTEEVAKAINDGTLNARDSRMDEYLRLSKELVELFPIDYLSIASVDDLDPLFFSQQIAAVWTGTWKNKAFSESVPFEMGVIYLPPITAEDTPNGQGTAYRVGGPSAAAQYGIPQSTADNGNLDLALDFLMFISAPQNFGRLAESQGGFIPMVAGVETSEVMAGFSEVAALPERLFNDPDARLTPESGDQWNEAMTAYFLGAADRGETKARLQEIWEDAVSDLCADPGYDWCP